MRKQLFLFFFSLFILTASAQTPLITTKAFSLGAELGIPTYGLYTIGTGASAKFELPVVNRLSFDVTGGFTAAFYKSNLFNSARTPGAGIFAPLKAGLKYYLLQNVYAEGEAGSAIELNYNKSDLFAFSVGFGFVVPMAKNGLDIGFRYEDWQGQFKQTAIRFAYRIGW